MEITAGSRHHGPCRSVSKATKDVMEIEILADPFVRDSTVATLLQGLQMRCGQGMLQGIGQLQGWDFAV